MIRSYSVFLGALALTCAFNASALPTFTGPIATASANIKVTQSSQIDMSADSVANTLPDNTAELVGKNLFKISLDSADKNIKIALAGDVDTVIDGNGLVRSSVKDDGTKLIGVIEDSFKDQITSDSSFIPPTANQSADAAALLLTGENMYRISFRAADVEQNIAAGAYDFNFVAQAYTD